WLPALPLLGRFAPRAGLVTLSQTFARRSHVAVGPSEGSRMATNFPTRAPHRHDARRHAIAPGPCSMQARRCAGLDRNRKKARKHAFNAANDGRKGPRAA